MAENTKKTKGFVETPRQVSWIMSQWIPPQSVTSIADFTAGRGALFAPYPKDICYGIELDIASYGYLINQGYTNIVCGDFFDKIHEFENNSIDALVMNPPYGRLGKGKTSMGMLSLCLDKIKDGGRVAVICATNDFVRFKEADSLLNKLTIDLAYKFEDNLFKPFASVSTVLILGEKGTPSAGHDLTVIDVPNERIRINTRAKYPEPELNIAGADEKVIQQSCFSKDISALFAPPPEPLTLEDLKRTIIDYMSFEYGVPREALEDPEKFWNGFRRMLEDYSSGGKCFKDGKEI